MNSLFIRLNFSIYYSLTDILDYLKKTLYFFFKIIDALNIIIIFLFIHKLEII